MSPFRLYLTAHSASFLGVHNWAARCQNETTLYGWNLQSHEIAMNESFFYFSLVQHAQFAREVGQFCAHRSVHLILSQNIPELDRGLNWMNRKLTAYSPSLIGFNVTDGV
jgi:hypothetical protein